MKLKDFIDLYDNWNGWTRVNDNNLKMIADDHTFLIAESDMYAHLQDKEVVSFGFYDYDNELCVRVR